MYKKKEKSVKGKRSLGEIAKGDKGGREEKGTSAATQIISGPFGRERN